MPYLKVDPKKAKKFVFVPEVHDQPGLISISQIQQFMKCPKSWAFNYVDKITPRVEKTYLSLGKLCHVGMAAAWTERFRQQQQEETDLQSIINAGVDAISLEYNKYLNTPELPLDTDLLASLDSLAKEACEIFENSLLRVDPFKYGVLGLDNGVPLVEFHFIVPCAGSKGMHGYIDAVLQDLYTGDIWAVDWKFRSQMASDAEEPFNLQNAVYNYALSKMGIHVTGSMTWQHMNQAPAVPTLNKNGTMSRAKIRTTWNEYAFALVENGLDPADYQEEMQEKLADIQWDKVTREYRNELTLQQTWDKIIVPTSRMIASKRKKITYSMFPWNCKICSFNPICLAELRGYDVDFIKQEAYMPKVPYDYGVPVKNGVDSEEADVV